MMTVAEASTVGPIIRPAAPDDADAICTVLRASILELCHADHRGDPEILGAWLANKTPETVSRWLANPETVILVAVEGPRLAAAGCVTRSGEVVLNYVAPDARFRGVSSAMLAALEAQARAQENEVCRLDSTTTAHRFYRSRGYRDTGPPGRTFGLTSFPMIKPLTSPALADASCRPAPGKSGT